MLIWDMRGSREEGQGPPPPEKLQNIGFLSNTGPVPLKNHKATNPAYNDGPLVFNCIYNMNNF